MSRSTCQRFSQATQNAPADLPDHVFSTVHTLASRYWGARISSKALANNAGAG